MIRNDPSRTQQRSLFAGDDVAAEPAHVVKPLRSKAPTLAVECRCNGCHALIDADKLMCRKHWGMVPQPLQSAVWKHYRIGQGIGTASAEYFAAAGDAIEHVARAEGRSTRNWFRQRAEELSAPK